MCWTDMAYITIHSCTLDFSPPQKLSDFCPPLFFTLCRTHSEWSRYVYTLVAQMSLHRITCVQSCELPFISPMVSALSPFASPFIRPESGKVQLQTLSEFAWAFLRGASVLGRLHCTSQMQYLLSEALILCSINQWLISTVLRMPCKLSTCFFCSP